MTQKKINLNNFKFKINSNEWDSKYYEKNNEEFFLYNFNSIEIKSYLVQFLKTYGLGLHDCKLQYLDNKLYLLVSFFIKKNVTSKINNFNDKLKLKKRNKRKKKKKIYTKKRLVLFKKYKESIEKKLYKTIHKKNKNNFLNKIFESLSLFTNRKYHIFITFKNITKNFYIYFNKTEKRQLKKKLVALRRYSRNLFFKESINTILACLNTKNSANLLTNHIASQLRKTKKHSYFIIFLKRSLKTLINSNFSFIKGIKIVIKGRINGKARAKKKIIRVGNFPIQSLNSKINYSESTSYTPYGTFGIKAWICENTN